VDATATYAYISGESSNIFRVDLSNNAVTTLLSYTFSLNSAIGLDSTNGAIFLGGYGEIYQYPSLGAGATIARVTHSQLGITGIFWARGMVVDNTAGTLYISDTAAGTESSTDGRLWKATSLSFASGPQSFIQSFTRILPLLNGVAYTLGAPRGLAMIPGTTILYFVEEKANKFSKIDLSTSAVTNIVTTNIDRPGSVAVDAAQAYAYVATWNNGKIIKVDLSATNSFVTLESVTGANGLALRVNDLTLYATSSFSLITTGTVVPSPTPSPSGIPTPSPTPRPSAIPTPSPTPSPNVDQNSKGENNSSNLGLVALIAIVPCGCVFFFFFFRQRKSREIEQYKQTVPSSDLVESAENAEKDESQKDFVGTL